MKKFLAIIGIALLPFAMSACGSDAMSKAEYTDLVNSVLRDSFGTDIDYSITWAENTMIINLQSNSFTEAKTFADAGNEGCAEAWQTTQANTADLCEAIYSHGNENGIDMDAEINIIDGVNTADVLFSVHNGIAVNATSDSINDI